MREYQVKMQCCRVKFCNELKIFKNLFTLKLDGKGS